MRIVHLLPTLTVISSLFPGAIRGCAESILRYDQPAKRWSAEAVPLGNGQLGCMVFGGVETERIQFNEDSLWTGDENPSGNYDTMGAYQAFGDLFIEKRPSATDSGPGSQLVDYARDLCLDDATAHVQFREGKVLHRREVFASHPDKVIVWRWTADQPGSVSGKLRLQGAHDERTQVGKDRLSFSGSLANGLAYEAEARLLAQRGKVQAVGDGLEFSGCDQVTILLTAGTSYAMDFKRGWRGPHPHQRLQEVLAGASTLRREELRARHVKDFQALFQRLDATWGKTAAAVRSLPTDQRLAAYQAGGLDPELETLLFQYGRYLLISCSRRPGLPANLQGLWNDSNKPPWSSDYHSNINLQMNYWLAEPANLSECHLPFFDLVSAMVEPSRTATRAEFGNVRGWTARTSHNIFGGHGWQWNIPSSAWYAQHYWEHFAFTRDTNFLREAAYPVLKEVSEYWEDHLRKLSDGTLVAPNGWSPEHGPREDGVAHDQQIIWDLFSNYLEAASVLRADPDYCSRVADMREHLAGPKIGRWGQLQEWIADRDDPKDQHRHTSHLFAVYPGRQISVARTPDFAKAAAVSLAARGEAGDSRRSWTWPWRCALWARLGESENAYRMVRGLLTYNVLPNLFGNHPPFQMDGSFGITAGICEMLVQSHAGEIELLPAVPKEWPEGTVKGLRARGGLTVNVRWAKGTLTQAELRADSDTTATIRYGRRTLVRQIKANSTVKLEGSDFSG